MPVVIRVDPVPTVVVDDDPGLVLDDVQRVYMRGMTYRHRPIESDAVRLAPLSSKLPLPATRMGSVRSGRDLRALFFLCFQQQGSDKPTCCCHGTTDPYPDTSLQYFLCLPLKPSFAEIAPSTIYIWRHSESQSAPHPPPFPPLLQLRSPQPYSVHLSEYLPAQTCRNHNR